jgi:hypothetical protein
MLLEMLLAAAQFGALLIGHRQSGIFFRDAVPKVFHQFEPFGATEFEKRCEFSFHSGRNIIYRIGFASADTKTWAHRRGAIAKNVSDGVTRNESLDAI